MGTFLHGTAIWGWFLFEPSSEWALLSASAGLSQAFATSTPGVTTWDRDGILQCSKSSVRQGT